MNDSRHDTLAPATLVLASCNTLNLANPGRLFYANQDPYSADEQQRKVAWLGSMVRRLNADVIAFQEVWDEAALRDAVTASGLRYPHVGAPGAEQGAVGTPRVALATRWPVLEVRSHALFDAAQTVAVPELGEHRGFERPILEAQLQMPGGRGTMRVFVAHLKSKRPKFLLNAAGEPIEDRDDPALIARATLRSLVMRAAECAALRLLVHARLSRTREPLVLMGDLNDSPHAVTTQMVAATQAIAYDRAARDTALFHAPDVQSDAPIRRDVAYSHLHQGWPDVLDQIWVSEEFVAGSRFAIGDLRRVDYFNDHLHEGRDRVRSDHGLVRALVLLRQRRSFDSADSADSGIVTGATK
jgi:endonuclease/exonuclease/phosphatase family metal-dependent hydrolase